MFFMGRILFFMERAGRLSENPGSGSCRRTRPDQSVGAPSHFWKNRDDGKEKEPDAEKNIHEPRRI